MSTGYKTKSIKDIQRENIRKINQKKAQIKLVGYGFLTIVGVMLISVLFSNMTKQSCLLKIGNEKIGYVENERFANYIIEKAQKQIELELGTEIKLAENLSTERPVAGNKQNTEEELIKAIKEKVEYDINACSIKINDKTVVVLPTENAANAVLNEIKNQYDDTKTVVDFIADKSALKTWFEEEVKITSEFVNKSKVDEIDAAIAKLASKGAATAEYEVKSGDTLSKIASGYEGVTVADIYKLNPGLTEKNLQIGKKIKLGASKPIISVIFKGKKTFEEIIPKPVTKKNNDSKDTTYKKVIKEGKDGKKKVTANVTMVGGTIQTKELIKEEIIQEPVEEIIEVGTKKIEAKSSTGVFTMPTHGRITAKFGEKRDGYIHKGIDIANGIGTTIYASTNGRVCETGYDAGGYGKYMKIQHSNGYVTLYGHLSKIIAKEGDTVTKDTKIAQMGNSGRSTGPHLHFELMKNGEKLNPLKYVR